MNLAERLLKIDKGEFDKEKTEEIYSKMLSETMGEETKITIKNLDPQEVMEISQMALDSEGNPIIEKTLKVNSLLVSTAIVNPDLKSEELLKHLGVLTPQEAALKLFKGEVNKIAARINRMAGFGEENTDNEIKN